MSKIGRENEYSFPRIAGVISPLITMAAIFQGIRVYPIMARKNKFLLYYLDCNGEPLRNVRKICEVMRSLLYPRLLRRRMLSLRIKLGEAVHPTFTNPE